MITFFVGIIVLLAGYFFYSRVAEKIEGIDPNRETPAGKLKDGVDYVPLPWWKVFLIQFLNIAGLGPIFGAIAGAMFGPVAFLWIVFGAIFIGGVHDYFSGMISIRHNGLSITEIVGIYLGNWVKQFMRGFTVVLMILVGAVFVIGPAGILAGITAKPFGIPFWTVVVFIYYFLATMLPIDKIIGRIYPVFGFALLFMALGLIIALFVKGYKIPELSISNLKNFHSMPERFPIFPIMFITIACGAISGFHSTQSPLMARCITNELYGRRIFYGAMISEAIVAMIWAAIAMSFYGGTHELNLAMAGQKGNAAAIVNEISNSLLGKIGGILALLGVVAAPVTTGDTAFRSARLIVADFLSYRQEPVKNRLFVSLPIFLTGLILTQINFEIIWRYFAWSNQTMAMVVLWAITVYLMKESKFYYIALIPAVIMTAITSSYFLFAPETLNLPLKLSVIPGVIVTVFIYSIFEYYRKSINKNTLPNFVSEKLAMEDNSKKNVTVDKLPGR